MDKKKKNMKLAEIVGKTYVNTKLLFAYYNLRRGKGDMTGGPEFVIILFVSMGPYIVRFTVKGNYI